MSVAKKLPKLSGQGVTIIIRGADSASAVEEARVADVMSDISTSSGTKIYPLSLCVKDNGNHHRTHFSQPEFDQVGENLRKELEEASTRIGKYCNPSAKLLRNLQRQTSKR